MPSLLCKLEDVPVLFAKVCVHHSGIWHTLPHVQHTIVLGISQKTGVEYVYILPTRPFSPQDL